MKTTAIFLAFLIFLTSCGGPSARQLAIEKRVLLMNSDGLVDIIACEGNCQNGLGKRTYANGDVYIGQFKNGKQHGQGSVTYGQVGDTWEGNFAYSLKHGEGIYTYGVGGGEPQIVKWVNGKQVDKQPLYQSANSSSSGPSLFDALLAGAGAYAAMHEAERQRYNSWVAQQNSNSRQVCHVNQLGYSGAMGQVFSTTYGVRCK